ncbi:T9SS type A sorting domain-containing protein [Spirosoma taeanense]|uniref:T9SS type A sorting domain-containing protein n=1 Tax=Spirosoma taeanense TaxID=2735870 RepID=A0A6M5YF90_9BACT|nr:T9SS type A sorting domain-containing protein [Spirosoma taeanense]QJW91682.1 T9SS type A sorting domain-containing protein [Spirosoma taeanense]
MKHISVAYALVVWLFLPLVTMAQIQVSFPTTRAVFQRSKANLATIRITGLYTLAVTRIEARMVARNGQGTSTEWRPIQTSPGGGSFAGDFTGTGGWYNLEVRGMNGDQQVGTVTTVERVGIGEVFIIAGQSNAQGIHTDAPVSTDDRVNCVNYRYPDNGFPNDPPVPQFTHLDNGADFYIAPRGLGSWCWGRLGDLLASRLNVPIMFFNAAFTGTAVRNWRESAPEGGTAKSVYDPNLLYPPRQPYINLKIALQYYANMLGMRAVLWHQGEADNLISTAGASYTSDLQFVINQSRQDYGRNMTWVVARTTYGDNIPTKTSPAIIAAQNNVIVTVPNVFPGPATDDIQIPRTRPPRNDPEGFHFDYNGLLEVANVWNGSLDDAFFQNSTPHSPAPAPTISVACAGNNLTFTINGEYTSFQWESGETSRTVTKGPGGLYRAKVKDARGNTHFTNYVRVSDTPTATVADNRPPAICAGGTLALTSNYDNVTWINRTTNADISSGRTLNVSTAGVYQVRYRDVSGCDFVSNAIQLTVNPLPATPTITNTRATTFCQGDNTILQTSAENVRYSWSNGQQNRVITVGTPGTYNLAVIDQNGCASERSNSITVVVNPLPVKPVITASGATTFCADRNVVLTAPEEAGYIWTNGLTTRTLTINQSGNFSVKTRNQFGCISEPSDVLTINVNPLPPTPSVSAAGATTFCEGGRVNLNATSTFDVVWSNGQAGKLITVNRSGNYAVQALDQNGCLSVYSPVISVRVNPLPNAPTLLSSRSSVICEGDRVTFTVEGPYTVFWSTGDSTRSITTGRAGNYTARVRDVNGCVSTQSATTTVQVRALPPAPTVNAIGTYTLEAVSSTNSNRFLWRRDNDSVSAQTPIIKAAIAGNYTAQSSIVYSNTLTCFSVPSTPFSLTIDVSARGLSVYPNPNPNKVVVLEAQENLTNAVVSLYTLTGQLVLTRSIGTFDERKQLILTDLPSGVYILRVQATDFSVSKRILLGL